MSFDAKKTTIFDDAVTDIELESVELVTVRDVRPLDEIKPPSADDAT